MNKRPLQLVELGEQRVDDSKGVGRLVACEGGLSGGGERLDLVDEHADEGVAVVEDLADPREEAHHHLAALGEPLREERVRVHLDELPLRVRAAQPDRELLRERLAERRLARARRAVQ